MTQFRGGLGVLRLERSCQATSLGEPQFRDERYRRMMFASLDQDRVSAVSALSRGLVAMVPLSEITAFHLILEFLFSMRYSKSSATLWCQFEHQERLCAAYSRAWCRNFENKHIASCRKVVRSTRVKRWGSKSSSSFCAISLLLVRPALISPSDPVLLCFLWRRRSQFCSIGSCALSFQPVLRFKMSCSGTVRNRAIPAAFRHR